LLRDAEQALRIFGNPDRPVQIICSGKAHPADEDGKCIIQRLMEWCKQPAIQNRVAFIEDYDMHTARKLVQGVDIWLNNHQNELPRLQHPSHACRLCDTDLCTWNHRRNRAESGKSANVVASCAVNDR